MKNKVDYGSLRFLPYTILTMFVVMPVLTLISIAVMALRVRTGVVGNVVLNVMAAVYSNGIFISYIAVIGALVCLYRLNDINRRFSYAWMIFAGNLVAKLVVQIMEWLGTVVDGRNVFRMIVAILYPLQDICIMFAVAFMLKGFIELYDIMDKKRSPKCALLKKNWYILQSIRIGCTIPFFIMVLIIQMNNVGHVEDISYGILAVFIILLTLSILLMIYHAGIGVFVYLETRRACREYYIYSYNSGRRAH